jgi:hypothetical protein
LASRADSNHEAPGKTRKNFARIGHPPRFHCKRCVARRFSLHPPAPAIPPVFKHGLAVTGARLHPMNFNSGKIGCVLQKRLVVSNRDQGCGIPAAIIG